MISNPKSYRIYYYFVILTEQQIRSDKFFKITNNDSSIIATRGRILNVAIECRKMSLKRVSSRQGKSGKTKKNAKIKLRRVGEFSRSIGRTDNINFERAKV